MLKNPNRYPAQEIALVFALINRTQDLNTIRHRVLSQIMTCSDRVTSKLSGHARKSAELDARVACDAWIGREPSLVFADEGRDDLFAEGIRKLEGDMGDAKHRAHRARSRNIRFIIVCPKRHGGTDAADT